MDKKSFLTLCAVIFPLSSSWDASGVACLRWTLKAFTGQEKHTWHWWMACFQEKEPKSLFHLPDSLAGVLGYSSEVLGPSAPRPRCCSPHWHAHSLEPPLGLGKGEKGGRGVNVILNCTQECNCLVILTWSIVPALCYVLSSMENWLFLLISVHYTLWE